MPALSIFRAISALWTPGVVPKAAGAGAAVADINSQAKEYSTSTPASFCSERAWKLSRVLPTLVRWRLRVHYANFFDVMDFPIGRNTKDVNYCTRGTDPRSRALHSAAEFLTAMSEELSSLDFVAISKAMTTRTISGRGARQSILRDLKDVSALTGVSVRQFSRAIQLYAKYLDLLKAFPRLRQEMRRSGEGYPDMLKLSVNYFSARLEFAQMAQTIMGDGLDAQWHRILDVAHPDSMARRDMEEQSYLQAITTCRRRYFARLGCTSSKSRFSLRHGGTQVSARWGIVHSFEVDCGDSDSFNMDAWTRPPSRFTKREHQGDADEDLPQRSSVSVSSSKQPTNGGKSPLSRQKGRCTRHTIKYVVITSAVRQARFDSSSREGRRRGGGHSSPSSSSPHDRGRKPKDREVPKDLLVRLAEEYAANRYAHVIAQEERKKRIAEIRRQASSASSDAAPAAAAAAAAPPPSTVMENGSTSGLDNDNDDEDEDDEDKLHAKVPYSLAYYRKRNKADLKCGAFKKMGCDSLTATSSTTLDAVVEES